MKIEYGFRTIIPTPYAQAIPLVTDALKTEGFGVLTEIDVQATMKKKLDVDVQPYIILGACNPKLAYRGLQAEPELGLLLPCNVIVYDNGDETSTVSIVDPLQMIGFVGNPDLQPVADEANSRLRQVLASLSEPMPA
ncbi:MAG: DUF302 domain-containing protein [Caldilineaceae bacterium]|nr:DUF302 domain-containing protein [Caldilineaceae bacterium]HRJ41224.1 DUF302 domain-containing protein [Caldilineaceae bacterium]